MKRSSTMRQWRCTQRSILWKRPWSNSLAPRRASHIAALKTVLCLVFACKFLGWHGIAQLTYGLSSSPSSNQIQNRQSDLGSTRQPWFEFNRFRVLFPSMVVISNYIYIYIHMLYYFYFLYVVMSHGSIRNITIDDRLSTSMESR